MYDEGDWTDDEDERLKKVWVSPYIAFQLGIPEDYARLKLFMAWWDSRGREAARAVCGTRSWVTYDSLHEAVRHKGDGKCIFISTKPDRDYGSDGTTEDYQKFEFSFEDFFSDKPLRPVVEEFNRVKAANEKRERDEIAARRREKTEAGIKSKTDKVREHIADLIKAYPELIVEAAENIRRNPEDSDSSD